MDANISDASRDLGVRLHKSVDSFASSRVRATHQSHEGVALVLLTRARIGLGRARRDAHTWIVRHLDGIQCGGRDSGVSFRRVLF